MAKLKLNGEQIKEQFHLYTGDDSEFSPQEEDILMNTKLNEIANMRLWEWTKELFSQAVVFGSTTSITLPDGFVAFVEDDDGNNWFYIGDNPYRVVSFDQRRYYTGLAYYSPSEGKLYMPDQFISGTLTFDYHVQPDDIEDDTYPPFAGRFHHILPLMMAIDHDTVERCEAARSKKDQNDRQVAKYIEDMEYTDDTEKLQHNLYGNSYRGIDPTNR